MVTSRSAWHARYNEQNEPMPDIVIIAAHPQMELSRVNARLARGAAQVARGHVQVRDLYALYPDYFVDVAAEQAAIAQARLIVWLHPVHWYGMPPLMKLWLDEVFAFGWAYGPGGHALRGKHLWPVLSTGGSEESYRSDGYNRHCFDAFLPPYEQTAALAGLRMLPPLVLHGAHRADDEALDAHAEIFKARLGSYPDWPEIAESEDCPACVVPADARPSTEQR